jgi:hypothetical protein
MSAAEQKAFEAKRYRQQIMLHEITVRAKQQTLAEAEQQAQEMLKVISRLKWSATSSSAQDEFQARIDHLAKSVNLVFSDQAAYPKWTKFALIGGPVFFALLFGFLFLERRRRFKAITEAELASLEEADKNDT